MTRMLFKIFGVLLFMALAATAVSACQCHYVPGPYAAFENADTVFVGKIIKIKDPSGKEIPDDKLSTIGNYNQLELPHLSYDFEVQEHFKGEKATIITVSKSINMCEFIFDKNSIYLIYAYKSESGNKLYTNSFCSRTRGIESAKNDILFIRERLKNKPEPRIYGSLLGEDGSHLSTPYPKPSLEKVKIIAESGKRRFETFTDKNGLFRFYKLPDGKYKVSPQLPKQYVLDDRIWGSLGVQGEINLITNNYDTAYFFNEFSGRNAYMEFGVSWNNKVTGRVLDAEGKPLQRAAVRLIEPDQANDESLIDEDNYLPYLDWDKQKNPVRRYSRAGYSPGKYLLAYEIFAPFYSKSDKHKFYYPQTTDKSKAQIISLSSTDLKNIDIKLPAGFITRQIEGEFLWGSGYPVEGGTVSLEKLENSDDENNVVYDSTRVDDGKFYFQVFENAEYWIHAKTRDDEKVKSVKIKIKSKNEPIKLILSLLNKNRQSDSNN